MAFSTDILITAIEWAIRVFAVFAVPIRRSSNSARTWLLLVLFLPIPGILLYFMIGRARYSRHRRTALREAAKLFDNAAKEIAHSQACKRPDLPDRFRHAARLVEEVGTLPALGGNSIGLLGNYGSAIAALIQDIEHARHHVHIQTYIFADDRTGRLVMKALERAAARGVKCRVLIDAVGSRRSSRTVIQSLRSRGVDVERTLKVSLWRRGYGRADLRNHRKIAVIDGEIAHLGSQNIVDAEATKGIVNEELVSRAEGPIAVEAQTVFATDWFLETTEVIGGPLYYGHHPTAQSDTAQLLASGPGHGSGGIGLLVVALIHSAEERITLTTPYFIPEEPLLEALRTAVLRGVAVRLILSGSSDSHVVHLAQRSYYAELLEMGVEIHLHQTHFLHAKHISFDDEVVLIGSSNVDVRSQVLNAEVTLVVYEREVARALRQHQERYIAASAMLTRQSWYGRSARVKFAENLARLLSPLL